MNFATWALAGGGDRRGQAMDRAANAEKVQCRRSVNLHEGCATQQRPLAAVAWSLAAMNLMPFMLPNVHQRIFQEV
ncbi:hypothetical protein UB23_19635 [Pseudomonas sp. ES3-33]|jgi:hypothetical protein|nr:hypothetical protein UB23_19635 [Pseudomonas sp. ES3-33]